MTRVISVLGLLVATWPSSTFAVQAPASVNGNAEPAPPVPVPRSDFIATMDGEFRKEDADKDGVLTRKEIEDYRQAMSFIVIDNQRRALFNGLDVDHNGVLTPQEFARLNLPAPKISADPDLQQADLDHDGKITLIEWRTAKLRSFDAMDTDKDGVVSVEEMRAAGLIKK